MFVICLSSSLSGASLAEQSHLHKLTSLGTVLHSLPRQVEPKLCCWRSSLIIQSQVHLRQPCRHCQSSGRWLMAALMADEWSCVRAMWLNKCTAAIVVMKRIAGSWQVLHLSDLTLLFVIWQRHQQSLLIVCEQLKSMDQLRCFLSSDSYSFSNLALN